MSTEPTATEKTPPQTDFRHLPPRVTPEQMRTSQAASAPDTSLPDVLGDEWRIRAGGAG
jgi:hypothetical protein